MSDPASNLNLMDDVTTLLHEQTAPPGVTGLPWDAFCAIFAAHLSAAPGLVPARVRVHGLIPDETLREAARRGKG